MRGDAGFKSRNNAVGQTYLGSLLADIKSGWSPACDAYPPAYGEWGVLRVSSVTSGHFRPEESKRLPPVLQPRPELEIKAGDVLVARANGARSLVGTACFVENYRPRLMLSDKILRLVPDEMAVDPRFLAILFTTNSVRRQIANLLNGGSGQNNISQADIRSLAVPLIPLALQPQVVAAYAAFDRRIAALENTSRKLAIIEAAMSEKVLSQENLSHWNRGRLENIATVATGVTLGSEPVGDGTIELPYLRVANVLDRRIDVTDVKTVRIVRSQYERFALKEGDLLLTEGGDLDKLGRGAVWDGRIGECLHQNHVFRVRCGEHILPDFLALYTSSSAGRSYFQSVGKQTTNLASINSTQVKKMMVPLPSLTEQDRVMVPIRAIRERVSSLKRQVAKLRITQRGVVEDLLSGGLSR